MAFRKDNIDGFESHMKDGWFESPMKGGVVPPVVFLNDDGEVSVTESAEAYSPMSDDTIPTIVDENGRLVHFLKGDLNIFGVTGYANPQAGETLNYVVYEPINMPLPLEDNTEDAAEREYLIGPEVDAEEFFLMDDGSFIFDFDASETSMAEANDQTMSSCDKSNTSLVSEITTRDTELALTSNLINTQLNHEGPLIDVNKFQKGSCDNSLMIVQTSDQGANAKRLCCVYCRKTYIKLARHLETVHKNEPDVKKFIVLPKGLYELDDSLKSTSL